jgi:hypothetical protein
MTLHAIERRRAVRISGEEHGILFARVRPGHIVRVVDVSSAGALVEGAKGLLPNAAVDLQVETAHQRTTVRGRVLRSIVSRLQPAVVWYRAAIAFESELPTPLNLSAGGYAVPAAEPAVPQGERVVATRRAS